MPTPLFTGLAASALALFAAAASAQTEASIYALDASSPSRPDQGQDEVRRKERPMTLDPIDRGIMLVLPQIVADAPVAETRPFDPPRPFERVDRGTLGLRHTNFSVRVDHRLSERWSVGGLFGLSSARLQQNQTEVFRSNPAPDAALNFLNSDTSVRVKAQSAALTLAWFPLQSAVIDAHVSVLQSNVDAQRQADSALKRYSGSASGRAYGLGLSGAYVFALNPVWALIPQLGLEHVSARLGRLEMGRFTIAEQSQRETAALLALQLQRAFVVAGARLTPYARLALRSRLALSADPVEQTAEDYFVAQGPPLYRGETRRANPEQLGSKRSTALSLGLSARLAEGTGAFVELTRARGSASVNETALALGLRFLN